MGKWIPAKWDINYLEELSHLNYVSRYRPISEFGFEQLILNYKDNYIIINSLVSEHAHSFQCKYFNEKSGPFTCSVASIDEVKLFIENKFFVREKLKQFIGE